MNSLIFEILKGAFLILYDTIIYISCDRSVRIDYLDILYTNLNCGVDTVYILSFKGKRVGG